MSFYFGESPEPMCEPFTPKEYQDGSFWIIESTEPDYLASGSTLEEARLNYWKGLALTLWLQSLNNE